MKKRVFNVTVYYDKFIVMDAKKQERSTSFSPLASDDVAARRKAIALFQKWYQNEYDRKAPPVKLCEIEYLAEIDE